MILEVTSVCCEPGMLRSARLTDPIRCRYLIVSSHLAIGRPLPSFQSWVSLHISHRWPKPVSTLLGIVDTIVMVLKMSSSGFLVIKDSASCTLSVRLLSTLVADSKKIHVLSAQMTMKGQWRASALHVHPTTRCSPKTGQPNDRGLQGMGIVADTTHIWKSTERGGRGDNSLHGTI